MSATVCVSRLRLIRIAFKGKTSRSRNDTRNPADGLNAAHEVT